MLWPLGPHALCELILMCVICVMKKDPNSCLSAFYSLLQSLMEVSKYALNFLYYFSIIFRSSSYLSWGILLKM